jgi:hypothetical protein
VYNPGFEISGSQFGWTISVGDVNGNGGSNQGTVTVETNDPGDCHSGNGCVQFSDEFDVIGQVSTIQQTITGITPGSYLEASFFVKETSSDALAVWSVQMVLDDTHTAFQGDGVIGMPWTQETSNGLYQAPGDTVKIAIVIKNDDEFGPSKVLIDDVFLAVTCNPPAGNKK